MVGLNSEHVQSLRQSDYDGLNKACHPFVQYGPTERCDPPAHPIADAERFAVRFAERYSVAGPLTDPGGFFDTKIARYYAQVWHRRDFTELRANQREKRYPGLLGATQWRRKAKTNTSIQK